MFTFKNVQTSFGGGLVITDGLYEVPMNGSYGLIYTVPPVFINHKYMTSVPHFSHTLVLQGIMINMPWTKV